MTKGVGRKSLYWDCKRHFGWRKAYFSTWFAYTNRWQWARFHPVLSRAEGFGVRRYEVGIGLSRIHIGLCIMFRAPQGAT